MRGFRSQSTGISLGMFCRHEYDVPESVVAKGDVRGDRPTLPRRRPTLHGPRNNTLPPWSDQYINYLSIY